MHGSGHPLVYESVCDWVIVRRFGQSESVEKALLQVGSMYHLPRQCPHCCRSLASAVMLLVLLQVKLVLEAKEAASTAVGALIPVLAAVCDEVGALAEGFPTYLTHMRLLTYSTQTMQDPFNSELVKCDKKCFLKKKFKSI